MEDTIIIDLNGCARCRGEGHPQLEFKPLTHPITTLSDRPITHWAVCPTNGEPILLERILKRVLDPDLNSSPFDKPAIFEGYPLSKEERKELEDLQT